MVLRAEQRRRRRQGALVLAGVDVPGHSAEVVAPAAPETERLRLRRLALALPEVLLRTQHARTHAHNAHTCTHARTHARTHKFTRKHARARTHKHTRARTHKRTHTHTGGEPGGLRRRRLPLQPACRGLLRRGGRLLTPGHPPPTPVTGLPWRHYHHRRAPCAFKTPCRFKHSRVNFTQPRCPRPRMILRKTRKIPPGVRQNFHGRRPSPHPSPRRGARARNRRSPPGSAAGGPGVPLAPPIHPRPRSLPPRPPLPPWAGSPRRALYSGSSAELTSNELTRV